MREPVQRWQPPDHDGIREHTAAAVNQEIDRTTELSIRAAATSAEALRARLRELDREWSLDRALMLGFAVLGGASASLAMRDLRRHGRPGGWSALFWTQLSFLAHHAIRRWCPPMAVLRRLGVRSEREISAERCTLEAELAARPG